MIEWVLGDGLMPSRCMATKHACAAFTSPLRACAAQTEL